MDLSKENAVLKLLSQHDGSCRLEFLSNQLYLSRSTLRRVCISLESKGLVQRYHGGVTLVQSSAWESPITKRNTQHQTQKARIARTASRLLQDNQVIFMDSSSTVQALCPYLQNFHNITVITNGIHIAQDLSSYSNVQCFICPGTIKPQSLSVVGPYSLQFLSNFQANLAVLSCKAIDAQGILEGSDQQAFIKRVMLQQAKQAVVLCDSSKQQEEGFFRLCGYDSISAIYTDSALDPELERIIKSHNCSIYLPANPTTGRNGQ